MKNTSDEVFLNCHCEEPQRRSNLVNNNTQIATPCLRKGSQ